MGSPQKIQGKVIENHRCKKNGNQLANLNELDIFCLCQTQGVKKLVHILVGIKMNELDTFIHMSNSTKVFCLQKVLVYDDEWKD